MADGSDIVERLNFWLKRMVAKTEEPDLYELLEEARAEIERLRAQAPGWRGMESAPKGGKWVLLWWPYVTDAPFSGYCVNGKWHAAPSGETWPNGPVAWQPLPEPPSEGLSPNSARDEGEEVKESELARAEDARTSPASRPPAA